MGGISDIPCVGIVLNKISEATVEAAYRGLRYMCCYKGLVSVLNSEINKVNIQEVNVSKKVVEEKNNGKILEVHVNEWQKDVKEIQESAKKLSEEYEKRASWRCIQCLPIPNPFSRFRIGREAVQKAESVAELTESGKELLVNDIAHLPPVENLPKTDTVFEDIPSRKDVYDKLWELLVNEGSPPILGIYGMAGLGKTRIAEQIWKEAKEKSIFDKVIRTAVSSEKMDVVRLQNELGGHLSCSFVSPDTVDQRASQLKESILNEGKILIILDDVWEKIRLDVIGIPFGDDDIRSKGCKVLFTSRTKTVCLHNNCVDPVEITSLTEDESWKMFKNAVGAGDIDSVHDEYLAKEVCKKCAGIPLIIIAVGKALKFMPRNLWSDALVQLENCKIESVPGITAEVYACLKLSFDNLEKDAKLCLLLCSLYPEDAGISIKMLIELGTGSRLVPSGKSRVPAMVSILKSSSLVLEIEDSEDFKLHDIIKDVARSIAVKDYAFSFAKYGSQVPQNDDDYATHKLLCLEVKNSGLSIFGDQVSQDIHTLWAGSASVSKHLFQAWELVTRLVNLNILVLRNVYWEQQHELSIQHLGKLRTIVLENCEFSETTCTFFPQHLQKLCIWECHLPAEPLDLVSLRYLQKLEIIQTEKVVLVANTMSSLSRLEELHIPSGFQYSSDADDDDSQLLEISNLTSLKSLNLLIKASTRIQDPKAFSNLSEYNIRSIETDADPPYTKSILLSDNQSQGFRSLIERAELVVLESTDVNINSIFNNNREAFADLKDLRISYSDTMEHLVRISHDHQMLQWTSFYKLTTLVIRSLPAMKYLFCNSVAKCLLQLKELYVRDCLVMESIISYEDDSTSDGEEDIINFPKLRKLYIMFMPELKSFCMKKKGTHSISTDNSAVIPSLFDGEVAFPALEKLKVFGMKDAMTGIWGKHYYNDNASSFCKLKKLMVSRCKNLETVIPLAMFHKLQKLETLHIEDCRSVISEVGAYESNNTVVCPLVALTYMCLENLPCLTNTWLNSTDHSRATTNLYPNLKKLRIRKCHILSNVFLPSIARDLMHLEKLEVIECEMLTEIINAAAAQQQLEISADNIVEDVRDDEVSSMDKKTIKVLLNLKSVWFNGLPNLRSFTSADIECHMPALEEVVIERCGLSTLFTCCKNLQQLDRLKVSHCRFLEYIVEDIKDDEISDKNITLSRLLSIDLCNLPNLKSFSRTSSYGLYMLSIRSFRMVGCPQLESFTSLQTSTGLVYVAFDWCKSGYIISDLNDYIKENRAINIAGESE